MTEGKEQAEKVLLEQAAALGMDVDGRWSVETLAEKVTAAQERAAKAEREKYRQAKKTPVLLQRNAFPVADVKVRKGEVVEVPLDMAKAWIAAGIALRADPLPGE